MDISFYADEALNDISNGGAMSLIENSEAMLALLAALVALLSPLIRKMFLEAQIARLKSLDKLINILDVEERTDNLDFPQNSRVRIVNLAYHRTLTNAFVVATVGLPTIFVMGFIGVGILVFCTVWAVLLDNFWLSLVVLIGGYLTVGLISSLWLFLKKKQLLKTVEKIGTSGLMRRLKTARARDGDD